MPTSTVEDYLKAILLEEQHLDDGQLVTMGQVAAALDLAPGTVTAMIKTLGRRGLVSYEPYSGVRLSEEGRREATHVLRRHRLIELFLVEILDLDWSEVHDEAERLEHAMSDKLIERIDALLDHPTVDPHGDPIPGPSGDLRRLDVVGLADAPLGTEVAVARVSDQEEDFLRFVERHGLRPGARIVVTGRDVHADAVTVVPVGCEAVTLGGEAAAKLWIARPS